MPMTEQEFEALQTFIFECITYAVGSAANPRDAPRCRAIEREYKEAVQTARDVLVTSEPACDK